MGITPLLVILASIFFSVYGLMHLYVARKILSQTDFSGAVNTGIIIFLVIMVISPVLCRVVAMRGMEGVTYISTLVSFLWMGIVFYVFLINVGVDFINVFGKLAHSTVFGGHPTAFIPEGYPTFFATLLIAIVVCTYAYFEASNIGVTKVTIQTKKLPEGVKEIVIAQISDLHLGVLVREKRLKKVAGILKEIEPDILFSTGDLVDANVDTIGELAEVFRGVNPRFGKYAVTGNHEFFAGIEKSVMFTRDAGFVLLRNECRNLDSLINIVGLDDPMAKRFKSRTGEDISGLLSRCDPALFTILLCHQPKKFRESAPLLPIDLQLSGHTHKGQLFPFNLVTHFFFPMQGGFFEVDGRKLYASRGTGTWGPPLRFLSPPEIVLIRLENVDAKSGILE